MRVVTTSGDIPYDKYAFIIVDQPADNKQSVQYLLKAITDTRSKYVLATYSSFDRAKKELIDIQTAYSKGIKIYKIKEEKTK